VRAYESNGEWTPHSRQQKLEVFSSKFWVARGVKIVLATI
jgi:hypothetical protein